MTKALFIEEKCTACHLGQAKTLRFNAMVGDGDVPADVMFVDVGPGREEEKNGQPWSGEQSRTLDRLLAEAEFPKTTIFKTYATKCANVSGDFKPPTKACFNECLGFLEQEILTVVPKVIVFLGKPVAEHVVGIETGSFSANCGQLRDYNEIPGFTCKYIITNRPAEFEHNMTNWKWCVMHLKMVGDYLNPKGAAPVVKYDYDYKVIKNMDEWLKAKAELLAAPFIAADIETTGFIPFLQPGNKGGKQILGIGFCHKEKAGYFLPIHPKYELFPDQQHIISELRDFFSKAQAVSFHNGNFDMFFLRHLNIFVPGSDWDTMLAVHLINENLPKGLEFWVGEYRKDLGRYWTAVEEYLDKGDDGDGYLSCPLPALATYCMQDCDATYTLRVQTKAIMDGADFVKRRRVLTKILMPLLHNIVEAEYVGAYADMKYVDVLEEQYQLWLGDAENKIQSLINVPINLRSPQQLAALLFAYIPPPKAGKEGAPLTKAQLKLSEIARKSNELGIRMEPVKLTKAKAPSTDEEVLTALEEHFSSVTDGGASGKLFKCLLSYRKYQKLLSTYIGNQSYADPDDPTKVKVSKGKGVRNNIDMHDRVHTTFKLAGTVTGRLSSAGPNMQNIPAGPEIRKIFCAPAGYKLVGGDFSQAELRIMAIESQDKGLLSAFATGQDIHSAIAAILFNKTIEECGKKSEERRRTKAINFGLIYGKGAKALGEDLGISEEEAQDFINSYFRRFKDVKVWMEQKIEFARQNLYVESIFGRRRNFLDEEIRTGKDRVRSECERQAMNMPIQSAASDCTCVVVNRVCSELKAAGLKSKFILTIHDEILVEAPVAEAEKVKEIMEKCAKQPIAGIGIDMKMDIKIMENWSEKD